MTGNIFINYRRSGDWSYARLLFGELLRKFDRSKIFMDVDSIAPGKDFVRVMTEKVAQSDILLSVIGPKWLEARDDNDRRRLDDPGDFVRIEIEQALRTGVRIIPLLVDGARMPVSSTLPESISALSNRNAVRLSPDTFNADAQLLIVTIEKALAEIADERDDEEWRKAAAEGTPDAMRRYLALYPAGRHASEAQQRLDELLVRQDEDAWNNAVRLGSRTAFQRYLKAFPAGRHAQEATERLDKLSRGRGGPGPNPEHLRRAEELNNWEFIKELLRESEELEEKGLDNRRDNERLEIEIRAHLATYPDDGSTVRMARKQLEKVVLKLLATTADVKALDAFIEEFPESRHAEEARRRRNALLADVEHPEPPTDQGPDADTDTTPPDTNNLELANWEYVSTRRRRREAGVRQHLEQYPDGQTAPEARALLEELVWERVATANSIEALDAFLTEFPQSKHAEEAQLLRDKLLEDANPPNPPPNNVREFADWEFVKNRRREASVRQHLVAYPDGPTAPLASALLEELIWERVATASDEASVREHLVAYPDGMTTPAALTLLEELFWKRASAARDTKTLNAFLTEFGTGKYAEEALRLLEQIRRAPSPGPVSFSRSPWFLLASCCVLYFICLATLTSAVYKIQNGVSTFDHYKYNPESFAALLGLLLISAALVYRQVLYPDQLNLSAHAANASHDRRTWLLGIISPLLLLLIPVVLIVSDVRAAGLNFGWPIRELRDFSANIWFFLLPLAWFIAMGAQKPNTVENTITLSWSAATILTLTAACGFCLAFSSGQNLTLVALCMITFLLLNYGILLRLLYRVSEHLSFKNFALQAGSLAFPQLAITVAVAAWLQKDLSLVQVMAVSSLLFAFVVVVIRHLPTGR